MHRFGLVACARWESAHVAEWLGYHRSIGFDHVYLYCNDDDPREMAEAVRPFGDVLTFRHWRGQGEQVLMYHDFLRRDRAECEWIMFLDLDEFLCLRGLDDLPAFVDSFEERADALFFNWLNFGPGAFRERPPGSVLEQYTRRTRWVHPFTKVLLRSRAVPEAEAGLRRGFWHHWGAAAGRKINVLGDEMSHYYDDFPQAAEAYLGRPGVHERIIATAQVCHFFMKAESDVHRRVARGLRGDYDDQGMWRDEFEKGNLGRVFAEMNAVEDLLSARLLAAAKERRGPSSRLTGRAGCAG